MCTDANRRYSAHYRQAIRTGRLPLGAHVAATEAHRLIAALVADDFTTAAIARALGQHFEARLQYTDRVTQRTALKIRRLVRQWTT